MNLRNEWYRQELKVGEESIVRRPLEEEYFLPGCQFRRHGRCAEKL